MRKIKKHASSETTGENARKISKMEASSLPETEFKTMVIRMLSEH